MDRRHVFDYRQIVSFLFTFCPPAYLADLSDVLSAMKLLTFLVSMCIVVYRRLLSTVMIVRKFPNRSLFSCSFILSIRQARLPFCDMKLTLFCVSTNSGHLLDVFQYVSVHPVPIEICYGLLSDVSGMQRILTHFLFVFVCRG